MTTGIDRDRTALRSMLDAWTEALRSKDAEGVVRHQSPDFLQYSLAPPLVSTAADAAGLNAWFATWEGRLGLEIRDLELVISGDVGGGHDTVWFRQTFGFRRVDGDWKIVHQHESVPFYMDGSDRAAVDLAPESAVA